MCTYLVVAQRGHNEGCSTDSSRKQVTLCCLPAKCNINTLYIYIFVSDYFGAPFTYCIWSLRTLKHKRLMNTNGSANEELNNMQPGQVFAKKTSWWHLMTMCSMPSNFQPLTYYTCKDKRMLCILAQLWCHVAMSPPQLRMWLLHGARTTPESGT